MNALTMPAGCLCLFSGAMLGGLFLTFKLLRLLFRGGKLCMAVFDVIFGAICAVVVFLCALAVDRGRLRLFQVILQLIGAWGAIAALDPLINGGVAWLRRVISWVKKFLRRRLFRPVCGGVQWLGRTLLGMLKRLLPKKTPKRKRGAQRQKLRRRRRKGHKQQSRRAQHNGQNLRNHTSNSHDKTRPIGKYRKNVPHPMKKILPEREKTEKTS